MVSVLTTSIYLNNQHNDNTANKVTNTISADNGDLKINWNRYPTTDIELSESLIITESGTYHLTGSLSDGLVTIRAREDGVVRLILDNVTISNSSGPAIACYSGDDLVIELVGENTLEDGVTYSAEFDEDVTGAIYSKADLTFDGEGSLDLAANYADGLVGKDDLKINNGNYKITANDDGIRGKDSVYIVDGDFNINAKADAIKSTNETDTDKGFVMIENGNYNIVAGAKGIKAINSVLIQNGNFSLQTYDDAVHSNNYVGIINGKINITSGDDGIHADRELIIDGGTITVAKAYEGLEAQVVTINNGKISLTTSDDGINAGGGADASATNRIGASPFAADENCVLSINGGELYINASGDGVDSNGWLYINGGNTIVDGPTNNGNGALDSGMGIVMNGGEVIALGSSGMAETLGSSSSVFNVSMYFDSQQSAKTKIEIKNSKNETVVSHTSAKTFSHIAVGSEKFQFGESYTIYLDGEENRNFTISSITTTVGNNNVNQPMTPPNRR
ncbi:carbohydrate-binding domain-containing protein [Candidatus Saccharibacteria bacterium]|nr:carbohydrate-binding domain-containing protein [Candidatus Saccharibacteria bacterium]